MARLKLYGMRAAGACPRAGLRPDPGDEVMTTGIKRRHEPPRIVGDLLSAEIAEKQARSIKYQLAIAKLPLAKDIGDFDFTGTPINETLIRHLASGAFLTEQRNAVLIGGTGTGKSHLAIAIARACIRGGARGRFYTVVDLVNRLESEARAGRVASLRRASPRQSCFGENPQKARIRVYWKCLLRANRLNASVLRLQSTAPEPEHFHSAEFLMMVSASTAPRSRCLP